MCGLTWSRGELVKMDLRNKIDIQYAKEYILLGVCAVLVLMFSAIAPGQFLNKGNLGTMARQIPELGLLSLAMMPVFLTGGTNLSNVATASLSGIVTAMVMSGLYGAGMGPGASVFLALLAGLGVALLCGLFIGFGVAWMGVAAMLFTLATMTLFKGISMNLTQGAAVSGFPSGYYQFSRASLLGIPALMWLFGLTVLFMTLLMGHTAWGRCVYMIGCNPTVSEYSGIRVKHVLLKVYLLSAVMSFLAAVVMTSRYNSAKVDYGSSYLLQSLTACVLGGMDIKGGRGTVIGVVLAVVTLQVISSGMNVLGINRFFTDVTTGGILILALALNFFGERIRDNKIKK